MPGFLGGSSGSSGTGGEISFPKEFIDPVTKLRVSEPQNLIDTDFEYGLQPTKWETVELINNTPSFFSKSGDTTIPNITAITTNDGTREITVTTGLPHGLAVGIPINVTGTKSITADGAYIINSIPNATKFTYLCRDIQLGNNSIEDLYSSVITGEFFQGSQLRLADAAGITTDGESISTLTVTTGSTHGFYVDTPFYFLNLNSTISQEFPANNNEAKSFDASNSATAQTFDGSNTLSQINIDWSNSATVAGVTSTVNMNAQNLVNNTITVAHGTENFANRVIGTPFYYDVVSGGGYFATNPRGVVFLKTATSLGTSTSTFQVSAVPDGDVIEIPTTMTGTFQLANQARTFAGNNINASTEVSVQIIKDLPKEFDGSNSSIQVGQVTSYSGSLVNVTSAQAVPLTWYSGSMVFYSTTGTAANGLTNNTTYFVDTFITVNAGTFQYAFTLKPTPTGAAITSVSGGTGTQTFKQIGVSLDRNIFHVKDHQYARFDMLRYEKPENGAFAVVSSDQVKNFYFVAQVLDQHNFTLNQTVGELSPQTISRTGFSRYAITPTTVTAIGMTAPITYAVTSGTLPNGLTLNTSTGVVSGTPLENIAVPGRTVIITATDVDGISAFQTHTYQFDQPPALYSFSSVTFTPGGAGGSGGPNLSQVRSGAGNPSWGNTYIEMPGNTGTFVWTVPEVATYRVEAYGAAGGWASNWGNRGGYGVRMRGDFQWNLGDRIKMVVGQAGGGMGDNGGGGGGSYVALENNTPLLVAGGGGGASPGWYGYADATTGWSSRGSNNWGGASGGNGGNGDSFGGGGGFYGNGGGWAGPGTSFVNGAYGGNYSSHGGFGGGGAPRGWAGGAGGGGGFNGGPGAYWSANGAGAGSYNVGTNQSSGEVESSGNGQITITRL
jgi:hypothetical protein